MPTIQEMSHGFDMVGIEDYLEELRAIVLSTAAEQVRDISGIEAACEENWSGTAKDRYLEELRKTANHTAEQFENLYNILVSEVAAIGNSMDSFDKNLFNNMQ